MKPNLFTNRPPGSPEEDELVGAFIRQREDDRRRRRYRQLLARNYDLRSPLASVVTTSPATKTRRRWSTWAAAAAALVALSLALFLLKPISQPTSDDLLASYLAVEEYNVPLSRSTAATDHGIPEREIGLLVDYGAGRFQAVIARMNEQLSATGQFYVALALITQERDAEANQLLKSLEQDPRYGKPATWYRTLVLLRAGSTEEAKARLQAYTAADLAYYRRARDLLATL